MKALFKTGPGRGRLELREVPEPVCGPGQVKIRVRAAGICGTDLHMVDGAFPCETPLILGHEFSGEIAETGEGSVRFSPGDHVVAINSAALTCGHCAYCWSGHYCFCPERKGMGHNYPGAFAEYVVLRDSVVIPIPGAMPFERAALTEPLACAACAVLERVTVRPTDAVVVLGPGAMGQLALAILKTMGCCVAVVGVAGDAARLVAARELGADAAVDASSEGLPGTVRRVFDKDAADVVIECAGQETSVAAALAIVKKNGVIVQVGIPLEPVLLDYRQVSLKAVTVAGVYAHTRSSWDKALALLNRPDFRVEPLIGPALPMSEWEEALRMARERAAVRVFLKP